MVWNSEKERAQYFVFILGFLQRNTVQNIANLMLETYSPERKMPIKHFTLVHIKWKKKEVSSPWIMRKCKTLREEKQQLKAEIVQDYLTLEKWDEYTQRWSALEKKVRRKLVQYAVKKVTTQKAMQEEQQQKIHTTVKCNMKRSSILKINTRLNCYLRLRAFQ